MTKKFLLNKFMKKTIHTFTLTLAISAFSCDTPENNTVNQENKELPVITQNSENSDDNTQNITPNNANINISNEKQNTEDSDSNTQNTTPDNSNINNNKENQNSEDNTENTPEINNNQKKHIVIYGIGICGKKINEDKSISANTANKFAIIYNQTENEIDISKWKIKKSTFSTNSKPESTFNIPENTKIGAKQYLLLTRNGYNPEMWSGDVGSDISIDGMFSFSTEGNHVFLVDANDDVIDQLDYIELSETKQKTYERTCNELYITKSTTKIYGTAYIFRTNPDIDTDKSNEDFTSLTINDECILRNSQTIIE